MSPEAQRAAIAEAYGWELICPLQGAFFAYWQLGSTRCAELPDYLSDLNAMHEAEKTLDSNHARRYVEVLDDVIVGISPYSPRAVNAYRGIVCATAAQRAKAFLKTLGKWEES